MDRIVPTTTLKPIPKMSSREPYTSGDAELARTFGKLLRETEFLLERGMEPGDPEGVFLDFFFFCSWAESTFFPFRA